MDKNKYFAQRWAMNFLVGLMSYYASPTLEFFEATVKAQLSPRIFVAITLVMLVAKVIATNLCQKKQGWLIPLSLLLLPIMLGAWVGGIMLKSIYCLIVADFIAVVVATVNVFFVETVKHRLLGEDELTMFNQKMITPGVYGGFLGVIVMLVGTPPPPVLAVWVAGGLTSWFLLINIITYKEVIKNK
jgi:hypothetical protein